MQKRADWQGGLTELVFEKLKFFDEAGMNLAMTRLFGRVARGVRVEEGVPKNYGENISLMGVLSVSGLEAVMTVNWAVDTEILKVYVQEILADVLRTGDVVVMDNLKVHDSEAIVTAIAACGAQVIYLPPYSPDLNPIEKCWSKIKTALRAAKARTREALEAALKEAMETVTEADARAWFACCGYTLHPI